MSQAQNLILTHLSKVDPETRADQAMDMRALVQHPGWAVYTRILEKALGDARDVVELKLLEHVEYASQHGRIRGLKFAADIPGAVIESGDRANIELRQIAAQENT